MVTSGMDTSLRLASPRITGGSTWLQNSWKGLNRYLKSKFFIKAFLVNLITILRKDAFFVDLFVRVSNKVAVSMYERLGYTVYRRVLEYYSGDPDEDAFDMRKALPRDKDKLSVIPLQHPVRPEDLE